MNSEIIEYLGKLTNQQMIFMQENRILSLIEMTYLNMFLTKR